MNQSTQRHEGQQSTEAAPAAAWSRRAAISLVPAAAAAAVLGGPLPANAATSVARIVQEPGDYEARFPDIVKLNDGRLMAVWHRATSHTGSVGTVQLSFGDSTGRTWTAPHSALANPGTMAGIDTRDPKLGKMKDGSVILTFFVPGGRLYYSVWKPGWNYFTNPTQITASGIGAMYSHGPVLALDTSGAAVNQVLVPVYTTGTTGGAWYIRGRWDAPTNSLAVLEPGKKIIGNNNPVGRTYTEPNIVQYGTTAVAVVRAEQDGGGSPAIIVWWNPYLTTPTFTYQSFTGVLANSHHILKTASGKLLFTYGDKAQTYRPTMGMMISAPTTTWVKGKVVGIYNSGWNDQGNPSSVEISSGVFLTLAYNAKAKTSSEVYGGSPWGGSLYAIETRLAEY